MSFLADKKREHESSAESALGDTRIAGRAGDTDELLASESKLQEVGDKLEAFQRDHQ